MWLPTVLSYNRKRKNKGMQVRSSEFGVRSSESSHSALRIPRSALGMTLVELLLALTLFSTLMASATGLLQSGLQSQLRWGETLVPYQQWERACQRLEQDLESAQPFFIVPFAGAEHTLEFARVATVLAGEDQSTLDWVRIRYRLDEEPDGLWLIREEFPWKAQGTSVEPLRRERLAHLTDGQFTFGLLDAQGHLTWSPSWDGTKQGIPRLIRVHCTLPVVGGGPPLALSRVVRNPSGNFPKIEETHE